MVSVVIPVYNTSRYLPQCLDSVMGQTYEDLEIILVDDGSTDSSPEICALYEKRDARIRVLRKENEGVDCARFSGLGIAHGEYVMFVDSDDWLNREDSISLMVGKAEETQADYVEIGMQRVMDKHKWIKRQSPALVTGLVQQPRLFDDYYISFFGKNLLSINIWGKLYRKSKLDEASLSPSRLKMGEDLYFNLMLFPHLERIFIMDEIGYNYRFGGMTAKYNPDLLANLKFLFKVKDNLVEQYHYRKAFDYIRYELKNVLRSDICQMIIFGVGDKEEVLCHIREELEDPIYQSILEVAENPGFVASSFVQAIGRRDAESIYEACLAYTQKNKWKRRLKQCSSWILLHI